MKKIIELDQYETFQPYVAEVKPLTPEQLQIEYVFIRAESFTKTLLKGDVITLAVQPYSPK